ncbi:aldo/keto reductase [Necropsobacter rosorum]|uniref:aldo/keto reductase n=1 Tax=Necropsobacter rosorum TaxID=908285 RepID=UPI000509D8EB
MKTIQLNNGVEMPMVGFGVYQIPAEATKQAVLNALHSGYRLIDTAQGYFNEEQVGQAIKESGIAREDIFITTKQWIRGQGYEQTKQDFAQSLAKLGLDYLDLYLIHQPYGDVYGQWRAMEELYNAGKIRAIGVSNFYPDRLADLMAHFEIVPAVNQIETHPFYQREEELAFHQAHGIVQQSWASFAEGKNDIFHNPILTDIAQVHGKSVAQVILRWLNQRGIAVIPKSVTSSRVLENADIFDFTLSDKQLAKIATLDQGQSLFFSHRDPAMVKWLCEIYR